MQIDSRTFAFGLLVAAYFCGAGKAWAQRRPDETDGDYARRTIEAEREAERKADAARDEAAKPNSQGRSYADELGRQYANQWARQAAEEKEREASLVRARQAFDHEQARLREEASRAARLQSALQVLAAQRQEVWLGERVSLGFGTHLRRFREGKADNDDLLKLLLFASWFPEIAEQTGATAFLASIGGKDERARAFKVLERIFKEDNMVALWHCALLDADPDGRYGVGELFGRWAQHNYSPSVEPEYWLKREQIKAGLTTGWDAQLWRLSDPDQVERVALQWNDLPGTTRQNGFVYAEATSLPVLTDKEHLDPSRREASVALDVFASAVCCGGFADHFRSPLWEANVARVRAWNAGYADVFEVYARWWADQERTPAELELLVRRAMAAGGRPATFAEVFYKSMRKYGMLLQDRLLAAEKDPELRKQLDAEKALYPESRWEELEDLIAVTEATALPQGFPDAWERFCGKPLSLGNLVKFARAGSGEASSLAYRFVFERVGAAYVPFVNQSEGGEVPEKQALQEAGTVLEAVSGLLALWPEDSSLRGLQLQLGLALNRREMVVAGAKHTLARSEEELRREDTTFLRSLTMAISGEYGLPRDEPRLRAWVIELLARDGAVPPSLRRWLTPSQAADPAPGSAPWVLRMRTLRNNMWAQTTPRYVFEESWRLCQIGFGLDDSHSMDARILSYAVLGSLESAGFGPAKQKMAAIAQTGSLEEKAKALCGDWYVVDPFDVADRLLDRALASDPVALRAFEIWILLDKLPADAVRDPYLKQLPSLRTSSVEAWLRAQTAN